MMTNLDDLKNAWQSEAGIPPERFEAIGVGVEDGTNLLQHTIFQRDMRESIAAVVVVAGCAPGLYYAPTWTAWLGFAVTMFAGLTIPITLWRARRRSIEEVSATNFREFVDVEIDYLQRQSKLLRAVAWWFLVPIYGGIVLVCLGLRRPRETNGELIFLVVYLSLCAAFCIYIGWMNEVVRKKRFGPLIDYYVGLRTALIEGRDFEASGPPIEFLRPAVRKPMSRVKRWIWIGVTLATAALVVAGGIVLMQRFDPRTGKFVISIAPVIAILIAFLSGIWRKNP